MTGGIEPIQAFFSKVNYCEYRCRVYQNVNKGFTGLASKYLSFQAV